MENQQNALSGVKDLFKTSWGGLKNNLLSLFLYNLVVFGIMFAFLVLVGIIGGIVGVSALLGGNPAGLANLSLPLIIGVIILAIVLAVVMIVLGQVMQIGSMLIINSQTKPSLKETFKKALSLVWPAIVVSLLVGLLGLGATGLLIIPGIIIGLLFSFASYEVVFNNMRGLDALRRSMAIVSYRFWPIVGRLLLLSILGILLSILLGMVLPNNGSSGIGMVLNIIFSTLFGWFALAYSITLYKQALNLVPQDKKASLKKVVIISLAGYIIGGFLIYQLSSILANLPKIN